MTDTVSRPPKGKSMTRHEQIDYLEFPARNIGATKKFFAKVFNWTFVDYGPEYTAFTSDSVNGGFFQSDLTVSTLNGSALIIFYSENLERTLAKVEFCGGNIVRPIFSFPGGRRFHFRDPSGNEFGVWSDRPSNLR
jgi:predicted enzyme related to lactoylglutathione lyase